MKIWVIDDNYLHTTFVKYILEELNFDYKTFNSGEEVLDFIKKEKEYDLPDLIIIDLNLGSGIRGEDLIKVLKNSLKNHRIKYIAFTADIVYEKKLKDIGFDNVLFKPVSKEILKSTLKKYIDEFHKS